MRTWLLLVLLAGCEGRTSVASSPSSVPSLGTEVETDTDWQDRELAIWNGGEVTWSHLEPTIGDELRSMELQYRLKRYELIAAALDATIERQLLEREAKRRGIPLELLLEQEVAKTSTEPTPDELDLEFERFRRDVPGVTLDMARPYLREQLKKQREQDRRKAFLRVLRDEAQLVERLRFPSVPRVSPNPPAELLSLGAEGAPVELVVFGGAQCYYCRDIPAILDRIHKRYAEAVAIYWVDFPMPGQPRSRSAGLAAVCAGEQGKRWPLIRALVSAETALDAAGIEQEARTLGLDLQTWRTCLEGDESRARLEAGIRAGREAGVLSTPTTFVNGLMVSGAQPYERFSALIEDELRRVAGDEVDTVEVR